MASAEAAIMTHPLKSFLAPIDDPITFQESVPFNAVQSEISIFDPFSTDKTAKPAKSRPPKAQDSQCSTLHAHAAVFVPRLQAFEHGQATTTSEIRPENRHSIVDERVRNSGTVQPTSVANPTTVLVEIIKSSPRSAPTPLLSSPPSSPSIAAYLSGRTTLASSPSRPITPLSLSSTSPCPVLSRRPFAETLPGVGDSDNTTVRTSISSPPVEQSQDYTDVIITKDDEVEHLFIFSAKPASVETLEETPLVDTSIDLGPERKATGTAFTVLVSTIAPTRSLIDRSPRYPGVSVPQHRAKLISVEPFVDATSLDISSSSSHSLTSLNKTRQSGALKETEGRAVATPILVDHWEPDEGMAKRGGRTLSNAFTMSQKNGAHRHSGLNGEGQLVDVGIPVNRGDRERSDARHLRRKMGLPSPSPRHGSPIQPGPAYNDYSDVHKRYQAISPYRQLLSRATPRKTIPRRLLNPSSGDPLQSTLMKSWQMMESSEHQKRHISQLLEELSVMINRRLSDPGSSSIKGKRRFEVDVFGSVSWGGETGNNGDLDLIVLVSADGIYLVLTIQDHAMTSGCKRVPKPSG